MAKPNLVPTALTLIVSFFLVVSHANHLPLDLPDDDSKSIRDHPSLTLPEPDFKQTIQLPSEKPESEPATVVDLTQHDDPEEIETNIENASLASDLTEVEEKDPESEPEGNVVFIDLRPITRPRFPVGKGMFEIRRPHHRCHHPRPRHHHHDFYHRFDTEKVNKRPEEVSYGNDMLMEDDSGRVLEVEEFDRVGRHGGGGGGPGSRAPSSWFNFHFGGRPRFDPEHDHHHHHHHDHDDEDHHHHHDHERYHDPHPEEEEEHDHGHHHRHHDDFGEEMRMKRPFGQERRDGGGLMKRVRKFLHLLEF